MLFLDIINVEQAQVSLPNSQTAIWYGIFIGEQFGSSSKSQMIQLPVSKEYQCF